MKVIVTHRYSYFTVYHIWATEKTMFRWNHKPEDGVGIGQASYYKGKLKTVAALNPKVVGLVCQGHHEWSARGTYPEYWSKMGEWQRCMPIDGDIEWWCLHSQGDAPLQVKYLPLTSEFKMRPGTSLFVLEGSVSLDDAGRPLTAGAMNHVKPRPHPLTVRGDAKLWLIRPLVVMHGTARAASSLF
jgi:hypothetical protein